MKAQAYYQNVERSPALINSIPWSTCISNQKVPMCTNGKINLSSSRNIFVCDLGASFTTNFIAYTLCNIKQHKGPSLQIHDK
jgi:hypothetical protein